MSSRALSTTSQTMKAAEMNVPIHETNSNAQENDSRLWFGSLPDNQKSLHCNRNALSANTAKVVMTNTPTIRRVTHSAHHSPHNHVSRHTRHANHSSHQRTSRFSKQLNHKTRFYISYAKKLYVCVVYCTAVLGLARFYRAAWNADAV